LGGLPSGGGTRIKIIDAAASQVPTVATSIGAEGLAFEDGKSIALRDPPRAFADAVIELLTNQNAAERMAQEAFSAFTPTYEKTKVVDKVAQHIAQTVQTRQVG
jgi:glycosyltransferase involved in cell wall biosynthesis